MKENTRKYVRTSYRKNDVIDEKVCIICVVYEYDSVFMLLCFLFLTIMETIYSISAVVETT